MFAGSNAAEIYGARSSFLLAASAAVLAVILGLFIRENREISRKPVSFKELLSICKSGNLIVMSVLAILSQFISYATVYGFTPIVAESLGANSVLLGLLSTLSILPGIPAGALSGSFFAGKLGERKTLFLGFAVTALSCLSIPFVKSLAVLIVTQVIGGFGKGVTIPLLMGLCIKNVEENKRGSAMGFFQAIYGLGMFAGPVVVGFISDNVSLDAGFYFTAVIGIIAACIVKLFVKDTISS